MDFTENHYILLLFRILLAIIAVYNGYKIAKNKKNPTWKSFIPVILAYSLYSGLRWGRGPDYNLYYYAYYLPFMQGEADFSKDTLWAVFVWLFTHFKLSWQLIVFCSSLILIISGCHFLRRFKPYLTWLLPAFVLGVTLAENLMRWYMAFSFVLIGLYWLLDGDKKKYAFWCCVAFFFHYGIIINALLFFAIYQLYNKKMFTPFTSLIIYTIIFISFNAEWMRFFIPFIQKINLGTRYLEYQENAEFWLTGGAAEMEGISWGNYIMAVFTIFGGYYIVKTYFKDKAFVILYNVVIIGLFLQPIGKQIELVFRIQELFNLFNKLFYALILYAYFNYKITRVVALRPIVLIIGFYIIFHYTIAYPLNLEKEETYYIWDSKGKPVLT